MKHVISASQKPPISFPGGSPSICGYERGKDPFARGCMPEEFQHLFPDKPAAEGWLALDWCGNVIGFARDGDTIEVADTLAPIP